MSMQMSAFDLMEVMVNVGLHVGEGDPGVV